ncbi:MAG: BatD family protein [Melioribacteraceae bacterium]|nr:BatD family protein [Melioribacteraceae bacterium]
MLKINYIKILSFIFLLITTNNLFSQKFTASVDRTIVGEGEQFQIDFIFEGSDINNISNFIPPSFNGFRILTGPNQSSSMTIINGRTSGSLTFSYILLAQNLGEFTIGSASITYEGKKYSTQPLKIKVEKGVQRQSNHSSNSNVKEDLSKNVFIIAEANKTKVLQGEQITVTYKLYTKLNIASPQISKLPSYEGFWAEEIQPIKQINFDLEMFRGERYRVAKIKQVALFPTKTGMLNVTPFELNIPVIVKKKRTGNDLFDDFFNDSFFNRTETIDLLSKSNTIKVQVDPLPSGAPASFSGAVGNFSMKSEIDKKDVATNESLRLRINISGSGNIKLLNIPQLQLPAGFEKYEPKVIENINNGAIVSGQKIIDYLIIPRSPGVKEIPPVEFTFFNPSTKKYVTLKSEAYRINVKKGASDEFVSQSFDKEDIKILSEDIRYIKTKDFQLELKPEITLIKNWFWFATISPIILLAGALIIKQRRDKLYGNIQLMKYQKAEKEARKRLKLAKAALEKLQTSNFYNELSLALYGYLEDKLTIQRSEFTIDLAIEKLRNKNVSEELLQRVKNVADKCVFARYAPQAEMQMQADDLYEETIKVIVELDSRIGGKK